MDRNLNTVSAEGQVSANDVSLEISGGKGKKILFLGNSITRHSPAPEIGWNGNWGMAASEEKNDYVHVFMDCLTKNGKTASFMTVSFSSWERRFWEMDETFKKLYENAFKYDADVIIVRLGENVSEESLAEHSFSEALKNLIRFFVKSENQKIIVTNCFWKNAAVDSEISKACKDLSLQVVDIGTIEEEKDTMAFGKFEHSGVAMHPSDKGMKMIAEAIFEAYLSM